MVVRNAANAAPTRARLLAAGRQALLEADARLLVAGLTVDQVTDRAELSAQTFHSSYPRRGKPGPGGGKAAFIEELLTALLDERDELLPRIEGMLAEHTASAAGDPRRMVREFCRWNYAYVRDAPHTQLHILACAVGRGHAGATASVRRSYAGLAGIGQVTIDAMLRSWGASLRRPFTPDRLGVVLTALVEGLVLRSRFDPDAVPADLFGDAVIALLSSVVDPKDGHEHIDDVVEPIAAAALTGYAQRGKELPDDPEQAIVDAARVEFGRRGYFATDRAHIAASAGIAPDTVRRLFPTNVDIVVAGLRPVFDGLQRRVAADVRLRRPELETLSRYGRKLAECVIADRPLFDAMVLVTALQTAQGPVRATRIRDELFFAGLVVEVVTAGQQANRIDADVDPLEIAEAYTDNILLRCMSRHDETADTVLRVVDRLILRGVVRGESFTCQPRSDPLR